MFTFLCQAPYRLIKFIELEKDHLNFKNVYTFLMMTASRPIFNKSKSYEVLKRIFIGLAMTSKELKNIDDLIQSYEAKSTEEEFQVIKLNKMNEYEQKMHKIAKTIEKIQKKLNKSKIKDTTKEKGLLQIKTALSNPNNIHKDII